MITLNIWIDSGCIHANSNTQWFCIRYKRYFSTCFKWWAAVLELNSCIQKSEMFYNNSVDISIIPICGVLYHKYFMQFNWIWRCQVHIHWRESRIRKSPNNCEYILENEQKKRKFFFLHSIKIKNYFSHRKRNVMHNEIEM